MKKFKAFLESIKTDRKDTEILSLSETVDIFKKYCNNFDLNNPHIVRQVDLDRSKYYLINPKKQYRKSANTQNYYKMIMDNSENWKDFPKRSYSIICTYLQNSNKIVEKSSYNKYVVVPYNNSIWSICPTTDIWGSFRKNSLEGNSTLQDLNLVLNNISLLLINEKLVEYDYERFCYQLDLITDKIIQLKSNNEKINLNQYNVELIYNNVNENKNLLTVLDGILNPHKNEFQLLEYSDLININLNDVEIWSDTSALFISPDNYQEFKNKCKQ